MAKDKKNSSGGASGSTGRTKNAIPLKKLIDMTPAERDQAFRIVSSDDEEAYLTSEFAKQKLAAYQLAAVNQYKDIGYIKINDQLRNGAIKGKQVEIDSLNSIGYELSENLTLYRGVQTGAPQSKGAELYDQFMKANKKNALIGTEFTDKGFGSSTLLPNKTFTGLLQFTIRAPKGTRAIIPDRHGDLGEEAEVILGSNTKYRVIGTRVLPVGKLKLLYVDLEVVN